MRIVLAAVLPRRQGLKAGPARDLFQMYVDRLTPYGAVEVSFHESEAAFLGRMQRSAGRAAPVTVLLDSRGKALDSTAFAARLGSLRDGGVQQLCFAVGPAGGWSEAARTSASWLLSFGPMTLPHELALVVLAEQLYRAQTILAGHPYHCGH